MNISRSELALSRLLYFDVNIAQVVFSIIIIISIYSVCAFVLATTGKRCAVRPAENYVTYARVCAVTPFPVWILGYANLFLYNAL